MKKINVLVFPCGSETGSEIHEALRYSIHVNLIGLSSISDHGEILYKNYIGGAPKIDDSNFKLYFLNFVKNYSIDLVFSTHDTVSKFLSSICEENNIVLVNGDPLTNSVARSKKETYKLFEDTQWVPKVHSSVPNKNNLFPLVIKPDTGQGGQGVVICRNIEQAMLAVKNIDDPVITEYLPGDELTVDCFTDKNRKLIWVGPRTRERVRAGIAMRSKPTALTHEITIIAEKINSTLTFRGPWFFQIKKDIHGNYKLLEISSRIAGTMVLQRTRGINFPLLTIHDFLGRSLTPLLCKEVKHIERRITTLCNLDYQYEKIYIDLDDTLIIDNNAVPSVMSFIYQEIIKKIKIILITRHEKGIEETLRGCRISVDIFDEIIHLKHGEKKSEHITDKSIFIDNHFPERLDVSSKCGIPVFDVDAITFLLR